MEHHAITTFINIAISILLTLILWPLVSLVLAWPVSLLWNMLMPVIFALPVITYWQAVGLMLLISILFRWRVSVSRTDHSIRIEKIVF